MVEFLSRPVVALHRASCKSAGAASAALVGGAACAAPDAFVAKATLVADSVACTIDAVVAVGFATSIAVLVAPTVDLASPTVDHAPPIVDLALPTALVAVAAPMVVEPLPWPMVAPAPSALVAPPGA